MPRVYLAANSGARIGFAQDVKKKLNVVWNDSQKPEDGFQSLCVDCDNADDPVLKQIEHSKTKDGRYKIDAVIGKEVNFNFTSLPHIKQILTVLNICCKLKKIKCHLICFSFYNIKYF